VPATKKHGSEIMHTRKRLSLGGGKGGKSSRTDRQNQRTDSDSGTRKNSFLTSFYAFPKKDKFVACEVPDNSGFLNFF